MVRQERLLAIIGAGAALLAPTSATADWGTGRWGEMVRLRNGHVEGVSLEQAVQGVRLVDVEGELVRAARATGIEFGA